jgi:hypothetical protein
MDIVNNENEKLVEDKISILLDELGIDYNSLKSKEKKHLINIENSLTNTEEKYISLIQSLKDNKPSISSVAEGACISSRQTIYNNPILKTYITTRVNQVTGNDPFYEIERLKNKIQELNEQINLMMNRDIDTEILRHEVKNLKKQIKDRDNSIILLEEQSKEMNCEIVSLKKEMRIGKLDTNKSDTNNKSVLFFDNKNNM